jgi:hypothetical protein
MASFAPATWRRTHRGAQVRNLDPLSELRVKRQETRPLPDISGVQPKQEQPKRELPLAVGDNPWRKGLRCTTDVGDIGLRT